MSLASEVLRAWEGKTLATAESCTGGLIGGVLTAVQGASSVYKGGIVGYCNEAKHNLLGVPEELLEKDGAVSAPVAQAMAQGAMAALHTDAAVSVTGLAGPDGDAYGNPVGTVFVGYADAYVCFAKEFHFSGSRKEVRLQAAREALKTVLENSR